MKIYMHYSSEIPPYFPLSTHFPHSLSICYTNSPSNTPPALASPRYPAGKTSSSHSGTNSTLIRFRILSHRMKTPSAPSAFVSALSLEFEVATSGPNSIENHRIFATTRLCQCTPWSSLATLLKLTTILSSPLLCPTAQAKSSST